MHLAACIRTSQLEIAQKEQNARRLKREAAVPSKHLYPQAEAAGAEAEGQQLQEHQQLQKHQLATGVWHSDAKEERRRELAMRHHRPIRVVAFREGEKSRSAGRELAGLQAAIRDQGT